MLEPLDNWSVATERCGEMGGQLATPWSEAENDQVKLAAVELQTPPLKMVWLGILGGGPWFSAEYCFTRQIQEYFWASGQPDNSTSPERYVAYSPPGLVNHTGWHNVPFEYGPLRSLCQLQACYRPDCPQ